MKLRNKETGKHGDYQVVSAGYLIVVRDLASNETWQYDCLEGFNDKWEDYKLAKPPIKDKKKRKLIRDWAEINGIKVVLVCETFNAWGVKNIAKGEPGDKEYMLADILFRGEKPEKLEFGKEYTIPELCGEEEE